MRPLEVEGKDYFFVTKEKFESWIAEKQLIEHALVYGDYKGIPRQQVWAYDGVKGIPRQQLWAYDGVKGIPRQQMEA